MRTLLISMFFTALLFCNVRVNALCSDGRVPSIEAEFQSSRIVATGTIVSERKIIPPDDPAGIFATVYTLKVKEQFKGPRSRMIEIISENTSSRFPMIKGLQYIVYLRGSEGEWYIDNCGNSALLTSRQVLAELRSIKRQYNFVD